MKTHLLTITAMIGLAGLIYGLSKIPYALITIGIGGYVLLIYWLIFHLIKRIRKY